MLDALIQYDNFPDSNTNFTQHIHQFIYLKSYTENTHAKFYFISRIPSWLGIRVDFLQIPCLHLFITPAPAFILPDTQIFYHNKNNGNDSLHVCVYGENINDKCGFL